MKPLVARSRAKGTRQDIRSGTADQAHRAEALTIAVRDATPLANIRYTGGVTPYLEILDSDRQLLDTALRLVRHQRDELLAVVRPDKALGGGWQE